MLTSGGDDAADATRALNLPLGEPAEAVLAIPVDGALAVTTVPVRVLTLPTAVPALLATATPALRPWQSPPDSLVVWQLAARIATGLVVCHHAAPDLVHAGEDVHGVWRALPDEDADGALARLAAAMPHAAHAVAYGEQQVWAPEELLRAFLDAVADAAARGLLRAGPQAVEARDDDRPRRPRARLLPWTARWAEALADPDDPRVPLRDDAAEIVAGITAWHTADAEDSGSATVELSLVAPDTGDGDWRLDLGVRDGTDLLTAGQIWDDRPDLADVLLRGLGRCARVFPPLDAALRDGSELVDHVDLDLDAAWLLLREAVPLLAQTGVRVRLPFEVATESLHVRLHVGEEPATVGAGAPQGLDLDEFDGGPAGGLGQVGVRWEVVLGEEAVGESELAGILSSSAPLLRWRDRWIRIDPETAARLRGPEGASAVIGRRGTVGVAEALALALEGSAPTGWSEDGAEVVAVGRVADLVERVRAAPDLSDVPATPEGFHGTLRPYQRRGVAWLQAMGEIGIGGVLADSPGLGKTIQLIGYLLRRETTGPTLVVCPTSVVGNWHRELQRFSPGLPVTRHHGADRPHDLGGVEGVVLTSYGTLRRDVDLLAGVGWGVVALDEAQHVKNPTTAGARAVRRLDAAHVVALTGTPLENRLGELWSLLDATNPGLLGSRARFTRRFVVPVEQRRDARTAARLRRLVAPFILRREKTDPAVIADLPDKIERTVSCALTPEQAALYADAVARVLEHRAPGAGGSGAGGAAGSAMQRRGRILALLTALKQICNHPAQYLGEADPALLNRSGKLAVARELVAEAVDAGEQMLLFTQYVAMGHLLVAQLGEDLGVEIPFLHGSVPAGARDRMVAAFQNETDAEPAPVLVVSLRAGGTGLNLTAATQVVHYDRWWNPAVEDQATDRAHRIGQTRTVEVHKLVTAGTVEERVADLLERKRALADTVVGAGETWITELDDAALAELVSLSADAPVTELDDDVEAVSA